MGLRAYCRRVGCYLVAVAAACVASPWAWYHQQIIRRQGRSLTDNELEICSRLGIQSADSIHIMEVEMIPNPMRHLAKYLGKRIARRLIINIDGITLGKGIYVRTEHAGSVSLIAHELVHIRQYQQAGMIWFFMREYIYQCLTDGYYNAPMEHEARRDSVSVIR